MKKLIFIFLLTIFSLSVSSQVNIKPETAKYYLEVEDERDNLLKIDSIQILRINNLDDQLKLKDRVIATHIADSFTEGLKFQSLMEDYNNLVDDSNALVDENDKLYRKLFWRKVWEITGLIVLTLLIVF